MVFEVNRTQEASAHVKQAATTPTARQSTVPGPTPTQPVVDRASAHESVGKTGSAAPVVAFAAASTRDRAADDKVCHALAKAGFASDDLGVAIMAITIGTNNERALNLLHKSGLSRTDLAGMGPMAKATILHEVLSGVVTDEERTTAGKYASFLSKQGQLADVCDRLAANPALHSGHSWVDLSGLDLSKDVDTEAVLGLDALSKAYAEAERHHLTTD